MAELYQRSGSPFYYARIRAGSEVQRVSTGQRGKREAQRVAEQIEKEWVDKLTQEAKRQGSMTLVEVQSQKWMLEPVKPSTRETHIKHLVILKEFFGDTLVSDITEDMVRRFKAYRLTKTTPLMTSVTLRHLRSLLSCAESLGARSGKNPVDPMVLKGMPTGGKRHRYLTEQEFQQLLNSTQSPGLRLILTLGVLTGLRAGEMQALNWRDVDFNNNVILVRAENSKTSTQRFVPMSLEVRDTLLNTLGSVLPDPDSPVIRTNKGGRYASISVSIKTLCIKAGLPDVSAHILRHTFASWALHRGISEIIVQDVLGHKTRAMTARYSHTSGALMQKVMKSFSTKTDTV